MSTDFTNPFPRSQRTAEDEFWGADTRWASAATSTAAAPHDDTDPLPRDEFLDERFAADEMDWDIDAWDFDDPPAAPAATTWDATWEVETAAAPTPRRRGVDQRAARIAVLVVVLTLLVGVAMAFTSDDTDEVLLEETANAQVAAGAPAEDGLTETDRAEPAGADAALSEVTPSTIADTDEQSTPNDAALTASPSTAATLAPSTTTAPAKPATTQPACASEYRVVSGDYWIRIADAANVRLADLLSVNNATVNTSLVPGRTICLPAGATTPAPPTTAAASSSSRSTGTGTSAPTTAAPAPTAPATTAAPATTSPPAAPGDVEAIIRSVWPDELEEQALAIAWRESNYLPTAKNYCCYGLFQIYWNVHKGWLDDLGITSADQLFDPLTNARAAYALYQRAGGFGPWGG